MGPQLYCVVTVGNRQFETRAFIRERFRFTHRPDGGANKTVSGFGFVRWMIGKPWPAHRYAAANGAPRFETGLTADPQHRLLIPGPERQDMTAMQGDRCFTVRIPHFRNDQSSGPFFKDQLIAKPVFLIQQ